MIKTNGYSEREKEMARNEIRNLKSSQHENLVKYVDDFYENGCFLIVMEFCSGGDLADAIKNQNGKPFSVDILLTWFGQLTSALKYLQEKKLIHRDLKPANVFLNIFQILKIGDFGLSKSLQTTNYMAQTVCGTILYMAPEVLNGEAYNHKADMWSLGCILYELVTLRPPFNGSSMMALMLAITKGQYKPIPAKLHPAVAPFAVKLLQVDPAKRPSAEQIMDG